MLYLNIALTELSTFCVSKSISPVLLSARKISKASLADIVLAGISQMPCMAEKARGNWQGRKLRWWRSLRRIHLYQLGGTLFEAAMVVEAQSAVRQKYIQISPNQKTVGFKHEDTLWWHPIYSLAYLSDNRCGYHLDDVEPKEFLGCGLLTTLRCLLTRLSWWSRERPRCGT